jgi:hypothetical protein
MRAVIAISSDAKRHGYTLIAKRSSHFMCTASWHAYAHTTLSNKYCVEFVAVLPCYAIALYLDCGRNHGIAINARSPAKLSKRSIYSHGTRLAARQCSALIRCGESGPFVRLGLRRAASSFSSAGEPASSPADRRRQRQRFSEAAAVTLSHPARFVSPDRGRLAGGVESWQMTPPPVAPFRVQSRT